MQFKIPTIVKSVTEEKKLLNSYKDENGQAVSNYQSLGWFILFEGSWEKLHVGKDKPDVVKGQKATIRIEIE